LNYISFLFSNLLNKLFRLNIHFSGTGINVDPVFIKTINFLNANFLSRFLSRRLSYGFELSRILKPIVTNLKRLVDLRSSKILGFRISCRGRFNKTQMASYTWEKYGPIPLNNFNCSINYSYSKVIMKYGVCGIKVWVFTSHPILRNYKSFVLQKPLFSNIYMFGGLPRSLKYIKIQHLRKINHFLKLFLSGPDISKTLIKSLTKLNYI